MGCGLLSSVQTVPAFLYEYSLISPQCLVTLNRFDRSTNQVQVIQGRLVAFLHYCHYATESTESIAQSPDSIKFELKQAVKELVCQCGYVYLTELPTHGFPFSSRLRSSVLVDLIDRPQSMKGDTEPQRGLSEDWRRTAGKALDDTWDEMQQPDWEERARTLAEKRRLEDRRRREEQEYREMEKQRRLEERRRRKQEWERHLLWKSKQLELEEQRTLEVEQQKRAEELRQMEEEQRRKDQELRRKAVEQQRKDEKLRLKGEELKRRGEELRKKDKEQRKRSSSSGSRIQPISTNPIVRSPGAVGIASQAPLVRPPGRHALHIPESEVHDGESTADPTARLGFTAGGRVYRTKAPEWSPNEERHGHDCSIM